MGKDRMNGIYARNSGSVRGLPADDAFYDRCDLDSNSQEIPEGSVELQSVHECLGWSGGNSVHSLPAVAQLASRPLLGVARVQRTETQV